MIIAKKKGFKINLKISPSLISGIFLNLAERDN